MSKNINFFKKKITETWPGKKDISTEFIFYLKEKLHLSDVSIYIDDYALSKDEEDCINQFIALKKQEVPLDYILEKSSFAIFMAKAILDKDLLYLPNLRIRTRRNNLNALSIIKSKVIPKVKR